ncbi:MAG: Unknown protein [uncultured Thiotrichaceae bacterium]|uniref:Uncharacterized protein n=1 Tax=uncultured Thiotrichaceae bacterium TaxID=298394 RepID=A0A6S6TYY2_9GAMM|nr:MAG: Unknown protein [uncultured Thiotrichaceae bacterium]
MSASLQPNRTHWLYYFLLLFSLFALSACSPVYKVSYDYQPPSSPQGLQCLKQCDISRQQCDNTCRTAYKSCSITAEKEAKSLMPELMVSYNKAYDTWLFERRLYLWDLDRYRFNRLHYTDRCVQDGTTKSSCYSSFYGRYGHEPYFHDFEPRKPSYAKTLADIKAKRCDDDCGCEKSYRLCYSGCGGTVKTQKTCIKNCD